MAYSVGTTKLDLSSNAFPFSIFKGRAQISIHITLVSMLL